MGSGRDILIRFIEHHATGIDGWGNAAIITGFLLAVALIYIFISFVKTRWLKISVVLTSLVFLSLLTFVTFLFDASLRSFTHSMALVKSTIGKKAPEIEFIDASAMQLHKLSDFKGRVIVLSFVSTQCKSCKDELNDLDSLAEIEKGNIKIIALTNDPVALIRESLRDQSDQILMGASNGKSWIDPGEYKPFTIILDKEGKVCNYFYGRENFEFLKETVQSCSKE